MELQQESRSQDVNEEEKQAKPEDKPDTVAIQSDSMTKYEKIDEPTS